MTGRDEKGVHDDATGALIVWHGSGHAHVQCTVCTMHNRILCISCSFVLYSRRELLRESVTHVRRPKLLRPYIAASLFV